MDSSEVQAFLGAMMQAAVGLAIGIPIALLCGRFVGTQLYQVKGVDAVALFTAILTLTLAATFAGFIPARRGCFP